MTDRAEVIRHEGGLEGWELAAVAASFVGCDAEEVCQVAMVVVMHPTAGGHEFRAATTITDDVPAVARVLRHAADHIYGGCKPCRRGNERRNASAN